MGIVEKKLAEFELSNGSDWTIELNKSGQIHIHVDNLKIQLSQSEFHKIVDVVEDADNELQMVKKITHE